MNNEQGHQGGGLFQGLGFRRDEIRHLPVLTVSHEIALEEGLGLHQLQDSRFPQQKREGAPMQAGLLRCQANVDRRKCLH